MLELYERASGCLERLLEHPAGRYLVVAHGAIINMALYAILGLGSEGNFQRLRFHVGNTAYSRLSYEPAKRQWRVYSINNQAHLNGQGSGDKHGK